MTGTEAGRMDHGVGKAVAAAAILSALAAFLVYIPALQNGFVNWDDQTYILENHRITSLDLAFLKKSFTETYFSNWHPLTMISYGIDYAIWGLDPFGYHLVNVLLHALNTALVAVLSARLIGVARPLGAKTALAAGLIPAVVFGLHPIHVESVAWVSERKDVLSGFFFLGSVLFHLSYAKKGGAARYAASLAAFALAIMSKPMAITLPAVLLLLDFYPLKRLTNSRAVTRVLAEKAPFFALSIFAGAMTIHAQSITEVVPFDTRLFSALMAYAFYIEKFFIPSGLAPFYPYFIDLDPLSTEYVASYLLLAGITAAAVVLGRRYRALPVAWLYYLGTLLPVIGLVQVGFQAAADRYMYLPSLSITVLLGAGAVLFIEKNGKTLAAALAGTTVVLTAALCSLTIPQISIWKDSLSLWSQEIKVFPDSALIGYTNRAGLLKNMGRYEEAFSDINRALMIKPGANEYSLRGTIRKKLGDRVGAMEDYRTAINRKPTHGASYFNIALMLEESNDIEGAILNAQKALETGLPRRKSISPI